MNDRYHVFKQGQKLGPFSVEELLSEIEDGQCEYRDWCLRIGATTCLTLRDVLDWEDDYSLRETVGDDPLSSQPTEETSGDAKDKSYGETQDSRPHEDANTGDDEGFDDGFAGKDDSDFTEQEFDFDYREPVPRDLLGEYDDGLGEKIGLPEEPDGEWETPAGPRPVFNNPPPADPMTILYSGRPSILSYPLSLVLTLLSLAAGIYFHRHYEWVLSAGIALAVIFFVGAQLRCMRFQFFIRPRQIEVVHGLLLRDSRELCIEEIGAIHIRTRGLGGLLGLESVEFASTESPMIVAVFHNVHCAQDIKSLIRRLQEAMESQR